VIFTARGRHCNLLRLFAVAFNNHFAAVLEFLGLGVALDFQCEPFFHIDLHLQVVLLVHNDHAEVLLHLLFFCANSIKREI